MICSGPGPGETEGSVEWHSPPPSSQQVSQHVTLFRAQSDAHSNASLKLDLRSTQSSLVFLFIKGCVCLSLAIRDNKNFENGCELLSKQKTIMLNNVNKWCLIRMLRHQAARLLSIKTWQCPDVKLQLIRGRRTWGIDHWPVTHRNLASLQARAHGLNLN